MMYSVLIIKIGTHPFSFINKLIILYTNHTNDAGQIPPQKNLCLLKSHFDHFLFLEGQKSS